MPICPDPNCPTWNDPKMNRTHCRQCGTPLEPAARDAGSRAADLLACPFCGGGAAKYSPPANDTPDDEVLDSWQVVCDECKTCGGNHLTREDAQRAWNARTANNDSAT